MTAGAIGGATLLAACQPAVAPVASDDAGDGGAAAEGIQLEYLGYEPDEVHGEAFDSFKEVMPDVDLLISPTIGSWPDMLAKINARIAAGDPPDIAIVATYGPPRIWSKKGTLVDLNPYLDADSDYDPVAPALLDRPIRMRYLYRLAFFLPLVTSVVAVGLMFRWLYDGEFGLVNYTLSWVGIDGPNWLSDPFWAMPAVAMVTVWQGLGYNMVLYLAGLQGIPDHLHEAATIDGAGPFSRFFRITIPLLTPTMFFILVMSVIGTFQTFGLIYVMTQGGPINSTNVYIYYLWQMAFGSSKMGYASAMAWILAMVIFTITMIQVRLAKLWVHY